MAAPWTRSPFATKFPRLVDPDAIQESCIAGPMRSICGSDGNVKNLSHSYITSTRRTRVLMLIESVNRETEQGEVSTTSPPSPFNVFHRMSVDIGSWGTRNSTPEYFPGERTEQKCFEHTCGPLSLQKAGRSSASRHKVEVYCSRIPTSDPCLFGEVLMQNFH